MTANYRGGPQIRKATKGVILITTLLLFSGSLPTLLHYYYEYARNSPTEVGFAYDDNGEVKWIKNGDANFIGIDNYDKIILKGLHFVHNHPNGSDFSQNDIDTCEDVGCSSLEVIKQDYSDKIIDFTVSTAVQNDSL